MKIVVHVPYGTLSQESGLIYLLANYLRSGAAEHGHTLAQLQCNGVFALCDRDGERGWKRGVHSCLNCMADQSSLATWSGIEQLELSRFLSSDEVQVTRRWLIAAPASELADLDYLGTNLYSLCAQSLSLRLGVPRPDLKNRLHEQTLRKLLLSSARTIFATKRFIQTVRPDLVFVAGGNDFITRTLASQARTLGTPVALFEWHAAQRVVRIHHPRVLQAMSCELLLQGITGMRNEIKTWSPDLVSILEQVLGFLEVPLIGTQAAVAQ